MDLGIALGSAANAGLSTYERIKAMESQRLNDEAKRQQLEVGAQSLESGRMDLEQKKRQRDALLAMDEVTKRYQYPSGATTDRMNAGDPTPGIDQSSMGLGAAKAGPDYSYLSDPAKFAEYQQALAPHVMTALGPEKGAAFMKEAQTAVANHIPQAAMRLELGDTAGATKLLQASPLFGKDLQGITPVSDATGKVIGYHASFGAKGTLPLDTKKLAMATDKPGEFVANLIRDRQVTVQERGAATGEQNAATNATVAATGQRVAATGERNAAVHEREVALKEGEGPSKIEENQARAQNLRDSGAAALRNAASNEGLRKDTAEWRRSQAAALGNGPKLNWGQINNELAREAEKNDYVKVQDPIDKTKSSTDYGRLSMLRSAAQRLARLNPEFAASPAMAIQSAVKELKDIEARVGERVEMEAEDTKKGEPGLFDKGTPKDYYKKLGVKDLEGWKKKRAEQLREDAVKSIGLGAAKAGDVIAGAPKTAAAVGGTIGGTPRGAAQGTQQAPAKPASKAEFDALESGAYYINPADGETYRKK